MFQELMPLLARRTLLLMVSRIGADEVRINVLPQRLKVKDPDENEALLVPLSISGTPKELDEALPAHLVEFVGAHLGLSSTLKSVKEQMDAAAKAAREAARKTTAAKTATRPGKPTTSGQTVEQPASGEAGAHDAAPAEVSGSLFGEPQQSSAEHRSQ